MAIVSAMIDVFEPEHIQGLTFGGIPVAIVPLDAGDILAACDDGELIIVERKTSGDFLNTLREERLFYQMEKIRAVSPWAYLVITGLLAPNGEGKCIADRGETGWTWAAVSGALLTVQEIGVHILHIPSDLQFERAIIQLSNRERKTVHVQPARETAVLSEADTILTSLPGIGANKAADILDCCGSAAWALQFLTEPVGPGSPTIRGVSGGTRMAVRRALGLDAEQYMAVVPF